jgi:hypothetical protein
VAASIKLRWKRCIGELRYAHEDLEISKEISKAAGTDFQAFYESYCVENDIDIETLNRSHPSRIEELYGKKTPEERYIEPSPESDVDGALVIHNKGSQKDVNSPTGEEDGVDQCDYHMTKDEKEIHEAFHKVFKKLAMILHPDKLNEDLSTAQKKERLNMFKQAKEALEKRKYFMLLELAEKFKIATPRNYKQQIRWMKNETGLLKQQINKEKNTYNYAFADCETDDERRALVRNFLVQIFGVEQFAGRHLT